VEAGYQKMWSRYEMGLPPAQVDVADAMGGDATSPIVSGLRGGGGAVEVRPAAAAAAPAARR
jgi:hypothetical protein